MSLETWLAFCLTEAVLCLTPGPAVLLVVSFSVARGARPGLGAALGILAANAFYFALSAVGVATTIAASHELFQLLKWAGAAYLLWLGARMLLRSKPRDYAAGASPIARSFARGFVVQAANPKTLVFFLALVPQFLDVDRGIAPQVLVLGVSSVVIEFFVLAGYVTVSQHARSVVGRAFAPILERVGGGLLIGAGARLALVRD